ncbi:hypothetical protein ERW51_18150 [Aliivibrio finisterrensis]|uniref:Uncharacterized protein n=1 Tax=Aliivibrio fischeri TaxID=668 RepID=A0A510USP1_ALIFS|nr:MULTISPECIES: hypothetical protein [Aliivibrio]OCH24297.1 hypothetical protein A6E03_19260 [Aliivibrio sp. 1S128]RYU64035.1 hypothetical protein ERW54_18405 [Aliivibrio finisterrensis]RYU67288.1 hypothetical protein ERW51_18150 [Aliivibrio finisterrensis]RYU69734.1 hypothetical protein ERW48_18745 [Aliivibrio finisterrensis]GEK16220.1 hypothetical protein AFI02nite_42560 [Aliivibrio fischeri]
MVAVHLRIAESNLRLDGFKNLDYYMSTKEKHSFGRSWRIGQTMRNLVTHAYIYCKYSNRIYSVPVSVDNETAEITFHHENGILLSHGNIEYGFRHDDKVPFFGNGGVAMHHKFYTDLALTESYN